MAAHLPPTTAASDSDPSTVSSSSQPHRQPSPTLSASECASETSTAFSTSYLHSIKRPLGAFTPDQLADHFRLPPPSQKMRAQAACVDTLFDSNQFHLATSLINQKAPAGGVRGGHALDAVSLDDDGDATEVDSGDENPTWVTEWEPTTSSITREQKQEEEEEKEFGESLDQLGEMMDVVNRGGRKGQLLQIAGPSTSSSVSASRIHRLGSDDQEEEVPLRPAGKRAFTPSSDLPLASNKKLKKSIGNRALPPGFESVREGTGIHKPHSLSVPLQAVVGFSRVSPLRHAGSRPVPSAVGSDASHRPPRSSALPTSVHQGT